MEKKEKDRFVNILRLGAIKPKITIKSFDKDGRQVMEQKTTNSFTYAFANILINALLNSGPSKPTTLYARFGDSGANPGFLAPPNGNIFAATRSTFITVGGGDMVRGGLWVPILSNPIQGTTDNSIYSGNQATFLFRIPANISTSQQSPANFNASTSYIYALGLAVSPNAQDPTQDIIISTLQANPLNGNPTGNFTYFPVPPGGQSTVDYVIPLTI